MHFSIPFCLAALSAMASAQNPFTFTTAPVVTAGTPFNITWAPSTGTTDTITLVLRQGNPQSLDTVMTIASGIQNSGSYIWTPPTTLVKASNYAFEIIDDGNKFIDNYTGLFAIDSSNTVSASVPASTTATASSTATATSMSTSTTGTAKSSASTGSATTTGSSTTGTSATSATGVSTSASSSASATPTKNAGVKHVKGSVGMLAVVGAVMAAL